MNVFFFLSSAGLPDIFSHNFLFKTCFHWLLFSLKSTVDMSKLIFILQDAFHVARNIAFATVKSLTDMSVDTILSGAEHFCGCR
jgi:hypothetical protein